MYILWYVYIIYTAFGDTGEPFSPPRGGPRAQHALLPTRYGLMEEREDSHKEPRTISGVWNQDSNQQRLQSPTLLTSSLVLGAPCGLNRPPGLDQTSHVVMEKYDFQTTSTCHCQNPQRLQFSQLQELFPLQMQVFKSMKCCWFFS